MPNIILTCAFAAALVMAPVSPEAGNILFLVAGALGLLLLRTSDSAAIKRPIVFMPLIGLLLICVAFTLGARDIAGLQGALIFAPLLAALPLIILSQSSDAPRPDLLAIFGLVGVAGTVAIALNDYFLTGSARAGGSVANPIHFADVALLAGFVTLIGVIYVQSLWRYVFLSGPVLAGISVIFSGTRGAIVALVIMAGIALVLVAALRLVRLRTLAIGCAAAIVVLALALFAGLDQISGVQRVLLDIADVLQTGLPSDQSTAIRLSMYQGGFEAFLASPIFGHGPFAFVDVAAASLEEPLFVGAPHLHNDIADLAASGGVLGLMAYFLMLLAPLAEVLRAPRSQTRNGLVVVVTSLVTGFAVMGLTNAMFGILTVTVYFAAIYVLVGLLSGRTLVEPQAAL